ncbi:hypothetical protein HPB52_024667 [Rhipicephalus sanguineus]|uniref:Uncharacterized protein n=1 Tax=Rhipicephalus sanguineus TaxID=34632 RepID=A0A9D4YRX5_RHISA|nr:hypothetical protein HPB52_024667 [Rhipicephalus sanguineus]
MAATLEDYTATLCQKTASGTKKTSSAGCTHSLPSDDCVSDVDFWPRVDISDIQIFVLRTSFITGEQLNSRKALEGHSYEWLGAVGEGSRRRHRDRRHPSKTF